MWLDGVPRHTHIPAQSHTGAHPHPHPHPPHPFTPQTWRTSCPPPRRRRPSCTWTSMATAKSARARSGTRSPRSSRCGCRAEGARLRGGAGQHGVMFLGHKEVRGASVGWRHTCTSGEHSSPTPNQPALSPAYRCALQERAFLASTLRDTKSVIARLERMLGALLHTLFCFLYLFIFKASQPAGGCRSVGPAPCGACPGCLPASKPSCQPVAAARLPTRAATQGGLTQPPPR